MSELRWQKSSFSGSNEGGNCVQLAVGADELRYLRESDDPSTIITTSTTKLRLFLLSAKAGEFDHLI
ncbi:DUF397 domain-containing protein [Kitasatospora sp. NPDC056273]|uniref:DUF397 domain-containing protein n=1 Tax=Kitasatospora sp. NPDC056273 TaxID=3345769 RepID=UPI0035DEC296